MNRKDDHIKLALEQEAHINDFDKIRFVHNPLQSIAVDEVDLSTEICGKKLDYPIYINAMTGGTARSKEINEKLAKIAKHFNLAIATGSMSIALKYESVTDTFTIIRDIHKDGIVMANLGADKSLEDAKKVISLINADILQIHMNPLQELLMPEGDRDFRKWKDNIREIVQGVDIPVIVKEVGFGMSRETMEELKQLGVKTIDVSGKGGTNFARIENRRRTRPHSDLENWGLSTVESLLESSSVEDLEILASGGVRSALDIVKALVLGASAVGLSSYFLKLVSNNSLEEAIVLVKELLDEIRLIMTLLGKRNIEELKDTDLIFDDTLYSYLKQRRL